MLDELEPEICDELTNSSVSKSWLDYLDKHHLFVTITTDSTPVFRLHQLLRGFLLDKLERTQSISLSDLHRRCGEIFERRDNLMLAIEHYVKAGEYENTARLLEEISEALFLQGNWQILERWIETLPQNLLDTHPKLLLTEALIANRTGDAGASLELSNRANQAVLVAGDQTGVIQALVVKIGAFRDKGLFEEAIDVGQVTLGKISECSPDGSLGLKAKTLKQMGLTQYESGDLQAAQETLKLALAEFESLGDTYDIADIENVLGQIFGLHARYREALSHFERSRQGYQKLGNQPSLAEVLNNLGVLHYLQGDLEVAQECLRDATYAANSCHNPKALVYAIASMADVVLDAGDPARAMVLYKDALEKAQTAQLHSLVGYLIDAIALVHRLNGDLDWAESMVLQRLYGDDRLTPLEDGLYKRSLGAILCEKGHFYEARVLLESACSLLSQAKVQHDLGKARLLLAYSLFPAGLMEDCQTHLQTLADLLEGTNTHRFLVAEARGKPDLLEYAISMGIGEKWFYPLLHSVKNPRLVIDAVQNTEFHAKTVRVDAFGLGDCRVLFNGDEVPRKLWQTRTAMQLLFFFMYSSRELRKEEVTESIWPDSSPEKSNSSFQSALYRVRRALHKDAIIERGGKYLLNPEVQWQLDALEFKRLVRTAELDNVMGETRANLLAEAIGLYKGSFLLEFDSPWVDLTQRDLHNLYLSALSQQYSYYMKIQRYEDVVGAASVVLGEEPYNEDALLHLVKAHWLLGNRDAAIRTYQQHSSQIQEDLGDVPSEEVAALYQTILNGQ